MGHPAAVVDVQRRERGAAGVTVGPVRNMIQVLERAQKGPPYSGATGDKMEKICANRASATEEQRSAEDPEAKHQAITQNSAHLSR